MAFIALVAAGIVVLGLGWPDRSSRDADVGGHSGDAHRTESSDGPARGGSNIAPPGTERSAASHSSPAAAQPIRSASGAPLRLAVHAPSDVQVGDIFQATVDIDTSVSMRDLIFSVTYDNARLVLLRQSEGEFLRQPGVFADFGVDEPSDGNVTVVYNARNGLSVNGLGTIIAFEFKAIGPGTSPISLHDLKANDADDAGIRDIVVTNDRVTIH